MSRTNVLTKKEYSYNYENTLVPKISAKEQLQRCVLASLLWEDQFYVDGVSSAELVKSLVPKVNGAYVAKLAEIARSKFKLRHMPLFLVRELARNRVLNADTLTNVIQRPDEIAEFLSLYWKDKKQPLSNQVKKGLANAFNKFNEYQFAKWDKNNASISLRDVMFLTHPTPKDKEQELLFKKLANKELETPDTWETQLSAGADKKETFERLMLENKLGALAFLRNLRNMDQAGVSPQLIRGYAKNLNVERVLPFRYVAAARVVPKYEDMLEQMMLKSLESVEKLQGRTLLLVDVSGSMFGTKVSSKSDIDRFDAAAALAMLCREICEEVEIFSFSNASVRVAPRRGFALREAILNSQGHCGTYLGKSLEEINSINRGRKYDRVIVFTDEQVHDRVAITLAPKNNYIINVAAYKNGINSTEWTAVSGFSEAVIDFIRYMEKSPF